MNMQRFSELSGLSPHTLRYYEKIGLLKHIQRNSSGHRVYSSKDLTWVEFIVRLKETAMPLADILQYARLREQGSTSLFARQALLEAHQLQLKQHIEQQRTHLQALQHKISLYQQQKVT
jgi:DNA-binding transcriptional MerR regulator